MTTLIIPSDREFLSIEPKAPFALLVHDSPKLEEATTLEECVTLLLIRDLLRLGWRTKSDSDRSIQLVAPASYEKAVVQEAMAYSRNQIIRQNRHWIEKHLDLARCNLASGDDALKSEICPRIEVCETQNQRDVFRIFRYFWSSPSSDYVGRRIRLLIRDDAIRGSPIIGIAALGSSIIHIPDRDKWIGWDKDTRTNRIVYMMDAYVIGALPPYNYLLGGKLVSYILASNELRTIFRNKYANARTVIKNRQASELVLLVTTSLYGQHSSQYNRLAYGQTLLYEPIGTTAGYGSLHISSETFQRMLELVRAQGHTMTNRFGDGPSWRMRVIRTACNILNLNSDVILRHSFRRGLYAVKLAVNCKSFLRGQSATPVYRNLPLDRLVSYWRNRWLNMRKQNASVIQRIKAFSPEEFSIRESEDTELW